MNASNAPRVAIVTGGLGGLGRAICQQLLDAGHQVVAADLPCDEERRRRFTDALESERGEISVEAVDVSDAASCRQLAQRVHQRLGRVDILVNGAGITRDGTLRKMDDEQWSSLMRVNLDGLYHMSRPLIDGMCERGFGRIVNISSVNGQTGRFGQTNYSAAKAGVHGFTMALARESARKGVTVNTVSPGYCATDMVMAVPEKVREQIVAQIPVGRLGDPKDVARAVGFLAADDAGYLTGINLPVNGGYFMSF
ncbi:acetoacetyl-CoA reductase [Oleiagrimonas sp. C23AA]|uniref:acetoacetyl-CoA reductase n=1 Tax=Oleiagrimonas sp. C23AA TaxID=2719047 RepID=UPI0014201BC3|nr:acetoacetyl-CoA reductase [Oleiagrimonas sp. C23AA]NII10262.1 acetoacetyl-CoA reductase [Oleiagrimonas sp. C23AA]